MKHLFSRAVNQMPYLHRNLANAANVKSPAVLPRCRPAMRDLAFHRLSFAAFAVISVLQISFFIFCALCILHHLSVPAGKRTEDRLECYASIRVRSGESLWEISRRYYSSEYKNMDRYIRRIKYLNHLSDENISSDTCLIIPYYEQGYE